MSDVPQPVTEDELLARFIVYSRWVRNDNTVRAEAFIPHPYPDLSVTRHLDLSEAALWQTGKAVAEQSNKMLYGRADVESGAVMALSLSINPASRTDNPNHANIAGWPQERSAQKSLALQIAAKASFVPKQP